MDPQTTQSPQPTIPPQPTVPTPAPPPSQPKSKLGLFLFLGILVIGLITSSYYLLAGKAKIQPAPTPQPTQITQPSPSPIPDETTGWNTYVNAKYHYSLKYPVASDLKQFSCAEEAYQVGDELFVLSENNDAQCGPRDSYYSIEISAKKGEPYNESEFQAIQEVKLEKETIKIDGLSAVKGIFTRVEPAPVPEKWLEIYLYKDGIRYRFILSNMKYENMFNQILSTFKFLE